MGAWNLWGPLFSRFILVCAVLALSSCGDSGGTSMPFSAMNSQDGTGSLARFRSPTSVTSVGANLYVADYENHSIRKVELASAVVTTLAGSSGKSGSTDGIGPVARFNKPFGITTDGTNLYVTDSGNSTIRKVVIATGAVTTLAGTAGVKGAIDGIASAASFNSPAGITTDNGTNLYVTDSVTNALRKVVTASRTVTTLFVRSNNGSTSFVFSPMTSAKGNSSTAKFKKPYGVATDGPNLYVANTGNSSILKVALAAGVITPLAVDNSSNNSNSSFVFSAMTSASWSGSAAKFSQPYGITTDGTYLYLSDTGNNAIRKLLLSTDTVSAMAGNADGTSGSADGVGSTASFNFPMGITTGEGTNLYLVDYKNNTIRKVVISTGAVTTVAGSAQ